MTKTVKEWLELLDEPYRTKALERCNKNCLHYKESNMYLAIAGAFMWEDTEEGFEYWRMVAHGGKP